MSEGREKLRIIAPIPLKELASLLTRLAEQYPKQPTSNVYSGGQRRTRIPMVRTAGENLVVVIEEAYE